MVVVVVLQLVVVVVLQLVVVVVVVLLLVITFRFPAHGTTSITRTAQLSSVTLRIIFADFTTPYGIISCILG